MIVFFVRSKAGEILRHTLADSREEAIRLYLNKSPDGGAIRIGKSWETADEENWVFGVSDCVNMMWEYYVKHTGVFVDEASIT